jgi:hypothetical protein
LLPNNYKLLITGHSLGAGVSALLGIILRSRIPQLRDDQGDLLRVIAFASPPVLDHDAALACEPFCLTVVNNADVIPRSSLANLSVLLELLKTISKKLEAKGMNPKDFESTANFVRMLFDQTDESVLMTAEELRKDTNEAFEKVELRDPEHLYVPGKVLHLYDLWSKDGYAKVPDDDESGKGYLKTAERAILGAGTSKMLRFIELDDRMINDHMSEGYRRSLAALLSKTAA